MEAKDSSVITIKGLGAYKPKKVLTNHDLSQVVETTDEWISTRTGIKSRHIAEDDELSSDMGVAAARQALERANLEPGDIDLLIVATLSPDMPFPATACFIQHKLGVKSAVAFDIQAACTGFVYALELGSSMLKAGKYKSALIIGTEKLSSIVDWEDRSTCVLFGDGAGAVVLSRAEEGEPGIIGSILGADGSCTDILCQPGGGCMNPVSEKSFQDRLHYIKMNGREVFKEAVKGMQEVAVRLLNQYNLKADDVDYVVPHQANRRIIEALSSRFDMPMERIYMNLDRVGNTSAASIPLALNDAYEEGLLQKGDKILLIAFGGGLTWGASLLQWSL